MTKNLRQKLKIYWEREELLGSSKAFLKWFYGSKENNFYGKWESDFRDKNVSNFGACIIKLSNVSLKSKAHIFYI